MRTAPRGPWVGGTTRGDRFITCPISPTSLAYTASTSVTVRQRGRARPKRWRRPPRRPARPRRRRASALHNRRGQLVDVHRFARSDRPSVRGRCGHHRIDARPGGREPTLRGGWKREPGRAGLMWLGEAGGGPGGPCRGEGRRVRTRHPLSRRPLVSSSGSGQLVWLRASSLWVWRVACATPIESSSRTVDPDARHADEPTTAGLVRDAAPDRSSCGTHRHTDDVITSMSRLTSPPPVRILADGYGARGGASESSGGRWIAPPAAGQLSVLGPRVRSTTHPDARDRRLR